jgi:hypothetical protein
MVRFENIPYVYELARIRKGCENVLEFSMRYDEYSEYSNIFDSLDPNEQVEIIEKARKRINRRL